MRPRSPMCRRQACGGSMRRRLLWRAIRTLEGYGCLVDAAESFPIQIVRWPAQGWRPIDKNSDDQGGIAEGVFEFWWQGETLYARNNAVGDSYLFGWSNWPEEAATYGPAKPRLAR